MKTLLTLLLTAALASASIAGEVLLIEGHSYDAILLPIANPPAEKEFSMPMLTSGKDSKTRIVASILSSLNKGTNAASFNAADNTLRISLYWQQALNYSFATTAVAFRFTADPASNTLLVAIACPSEYRLARRSWSLTGGVPTWDFLQDFSKICDKDILQSVGKMAGAFTLENEAFTARNEQKAKELEAAGILNQRNQQVLAEDSELAVARLSKIAIGLEDRCEMMKDDAPGFFDSLDAMSRESRKTVIKGAYHNGQLTCQFGGNVFLKDLNKAGWMVVSEQENRTNAGKVQMVYLVKKAR